MNKKLYYLLFLGGIIGMFFSTLITIEKINLLQDVNYVPPCSINPIISCGSVMKTPQASVFGFPNSLIGIAGFAMVTAIGAALLAGAVFKRWFWLGIQAGLTFAIIFVYWLFYQSVYNIQALCPYCMVVWTVTIPMFVYMTFYNLTQGHIKIPENIAMRLNSHRAVLLTLLYAVIILAILSHFRSYWVTLL